MSLAQALWSARVRGDKVDVSSAEKPGGDEAAYAVQREITELCGAKLVGWKIGATAQAAMDLLGFTEPFFGPLYDSHIHETGEDVPVVAAHGPGIETEFVVGLAADLPTRQGAYSVDDVKAAVGWVAPGFEIIGTRLSTGLAGAGNLLIADGGANMDFVLGPRASNWREFDLSQHGASLAINDEQVASGHSGMLLFGNTIGAVVWLANSPHLAPRGLKAGDIITTGSCTGVIPIKIGDHARADFGTLGTITTRFVASP